MNISVCITVLNEEKTVRSLLNSLLNQTKKPDEIIIVDGGSTDKTIEIIKHYQRKVRNLRLVREDCSRARGRNIAVEVAKNEIIAMTDAGCRAREDWLEKITAPFQNPKIEISAGFYTMRGRTPVEKAMTRFLGVPPHKFNIHFLPSARSIAFRKSVWEKVGGFPEEAVNSAEDTYFNYRAVKMGVRYARVRDAVVEWRMPVSVYDFFLKIRNYAEWDARTKVWFFPGKGLSSHNIKALFVILRYLAGMILLFMGLKYHILLIYLLIGLLAYLFIIFRKAGLWGIPLQFIADFAVMKGFLYGIFGSCSQRY